MIRVIFREKPAKAFGAKVKDIKDDLVAKLVANAGSNIIEITEKKGAIEWKADYQIIDWVWSDWTRNTLEITVTMIGDISFIPQKTVELINVNFDENKV